MIVSRRLHDYRIHTIGSPARRGTCLPAAAAQAAARLSRGLRHRGRKNDPLFRLRRVPRVAQERLDEDTLNRIFERLGAEDTVDEVAAAWVAVDLLRRVYQAPDRDTAHRRLVALYEWVVDIAVAEVARVASTIDTWQDEVLAFFDTRASNAPTESCNVRISRPGEPLAASRTAPTIGTRILLNAGQPRRLPTTTRIRSYTLTTMA